MPAFLWRFKMNRPQSPHYTQALEVPLTDPPRRVLTASSPWDCLQTMMFTMSGAHCLSLSASQRRQVSGSPGQALPASVSLRSRCRSSVSSPRCTSH